MLTANQVCFLTKQHPSAINIRRFLQPWESSLRPWEDIWVHQEIFICSSLVQPLLKDQNKTMMEHSQLYKMASAENRHQVSWSLLFNSLHSLKADTSLQESPGVTSIKGACLRQGCHPKRGRGGGVLTKQNFKWGGSTQRFNPLPFFYHFWQTMFTLSIPSIDKGSPFT